MDEADHNFADHIKPAENLCRVCENKLRKRSAKKNFKCENYSADFFFFNVDISKDTDTFGTLMCNCCYRRISNIKARLNLPSTLETARRQGEEGKKVWGNYSERLNASQCTVCSQYQKLAKGGKFIDGRKKKIQSSNKGEGSTTIFIRKPSPFRPFIYGNAFPRTFAGSPSYDTLLF